MISRIVIGVSTVLLALVPVTFAADPADGIKLLVERGPGFVFVSSSWMEAVVAACGRTPGGAMPGSDEPHARVLEQGTMDATTNRLRAVTSLLL
jgi:hypothetical protein